MRARGVAQFPSPRIRDARNYPETLLLQSGLHVALPRRATHRIARRNFAATVEDCAIEHIGVSMQRPKSLDLTLRSLALLLALPIVLLGQDAGSQTIQNWSAPPYWQPNGAASHGAGLARKSEAVADVAQT